MTAEIERFLAAAAADADLRAAVAATDGDLDAIVALATARDYAISRSDADSYIAAHAHELDDGQLDHVAGGGKFAENFKEKWRDKFWHMSHGSLR